jgi:hypothetical protein
MAELAHSVKLVETSEPDAERKTYKLYVNDEEFPYYTAVGGVAIEPGYQGFGQWNTLVVRIPVEGPVDIPSDYVVQ